MPTTMTEPKRSHAGEPEYLSVATAAGVLDVSTRTVWRLVADGHLDTIRLASRAVRIPRASLDAYIARREEERDRENGR